MDIYWIQDREKRGPLPEVEVVSLLEAGLIPENARAWHAGCPEWMRIHELPVLKEMFERQEEEKRQRAPEHAERQGEGTAAAEALSVEAEEVPAEHAGTEGEREEVVLVVPYPYVRLLGRTADMMMHMTLYLALLRAFGAEFDPDLLPGSYEALLYICLPMVVMEAFLLNRLGTTPGKAMMGVSVRDYRGNRLSFSTSFRRSLSVMVLGMGCFAPSLMLLALFFSWWWVRRFGFAPWDRRLGTTDVLNEPLSFRKVLLTLALVILCLQIMYVLLLPWLPDMEAYVHTAGQM